MVDQAHLIPLFPLAAFAINIFFGKRLKGLSAFVSIVASGLSFIFSYITFQGFLQGHGSYTLGKWIDLFGVPINFGIMVDGLSVMMLLTVTIVATLIKIYSMGYMHDDARYSRYFAYISLFTASMLGLIIADNLLMLYMCWEGVGLCSYLLISFWFEKPSACKAGVKAFITTRIGDTGFLIGIFLLFFASHNLSFSQLAPIPGKEGLMIAAALLIFFGAVGKSAQFPLHVWLPDAMEGPTTVSALIHAATMVAAGVYLVARCFGLFSAFPLCEQVIATIGGISALMAALMATVNNDIKRILAYSTMSQLGLMMVALGVGGFHAGTFHLMTHAFFKALLFLCAGSVIHAVHTQNIQEMGGLFSKMKITGATLVIGMLAISGVPPFAGFWSKDEILIAVFHHSPFLFAVVSLASFLTAFYMARLVFLVLFGKVRKEVHAHESPLSMTIPLIILAFFAMFSGLLGSPLCDHAFQRFVTIDPHHGFEGHMDLNIMFFSIGLSVGGILLAYVIYIAQNKILPQSVRSQFRWLYDLLINKFYIDEIYEVIFVKPFERIANSSFRFDATVVDGAVNGVGNIFQQLSAIFRQLQTGLIQNYLLMIVVGVIVLFTVLWGVR